MNKPANNQQFTSLSELDGVTVFTDPVDLLTYRRDSTTFASIFSKPLGSVNQAPCFR